MNINLVHAYGRSSSCQHPGNSVLEDKIIFLEELCATALRCGATCLRLELYLSRVAGALGLQGDFFLTPRRSIVLIGAEGSARQVRVVHTGEVSFDMGRLGSIEGVARRVGRGELTAAEGTAALGELAKKPPRYGAGWTALFGGLTASAFAVLLSATWLDAAVAGLLSVVAFVVTSWTSRWRVLRAASNLLAAFVVALLASVFAVFSDGSSFLILTLCGVVMLLPGFALTVGLGEFLRGLVDAGAQRISSALVTSAELFVGGTLGALLAAALVGDTATAAASGSPGVWRWAAVIVMAIGYVVVLRIPLRYAGWTVVGALLVWLGVTIGAEMGFWQGSFLGGLLLGLYSSGFARHTAQPASTLTLSCVMILVPGVAVLMGLHAAATEGAHAGLTSEWHAFVNGLAIVVGFVVANTLVPQEGEL